MSLDLHFRPATEADLPEVSACVAALYEEHPGPVPVDLSKVARTVRHFIAHPEAGGVHLLYERGHTEPLGYVIVATYWSNEYGGVALILDELYMKPDHRSRGIGRWVIERLHTLAPGQDVRALLLEVDTDNPRARRLYESLGFEETGRHHLRRLEKR